MGISDVGKTGGTSIPQGGDHIPKEKSSALVGGQIILNLNKTSSGLAAEIIRLKDSKNGLISTDDNQDILDLQLAIDRARSGSSEDRLSLDEIIGNYKITKPDQAVKRLGVIRPRTNSPFAINAPVSRNEARELAHSHYDQGQALYKEGKYPEALYAFTQAGILMPHADVEKAKASCSQKIINGYIRENVDKINKEILNQNLF